MIFSDLKLAEPILRAVAMEKYASPSPIQEKAIPHLLAGRDMLGCAQTGTGKTAAFALPIVHSLYTQGNTTRQNRLPKALVLTPTRELAAQVASCFTSFGKFSHIRTAVVFGGVGQGPQVAALRRGVDVLVATPGRLLDLMNQKRCDLRNVTTLVLDEADHMLDMGFIHDVEKIIEKIPQKRQTLLFSATMPKAIASLAKSILHDPINVAVTPVSSPVESVTQSVYHVNRADKSKLLIALLQKMDIASCLVFARTKHGADKLCKVLKTAGIRSGAIHGNKSQTSRKETLAAFKKGALRVLVATDIAARGIDIQALPYVFNYDLPDVPETYIHRIGRTGRAGNQGSAITFCDPGERSSLREIESLISFRLPVVRDHPCAKPSEIKALPEKRALPSSDRGTPRKPRSVSGEFKTREKRFSGNGKSAQFGSRDGARKTTRGRGRKRVGASASPVKSPVKKRVS